VKLCRRRFLHLVAGAAALPAVSRVTWAQAYPSRPVTMIVPAPAGGPTDTLARIMAEPLRAALGQPIIIENVGGAGGSIGVGRAVRAAADGYTLSIGNWSTHVGASAIYPVQYDVLKDLEPVSLLSFAPLMIVGRPNLPATNVAELIAWMKAKPGKATTGTTGAGSAPHLCSIYFEDKTGIRSQYVPYRGAAPAVQDLVGGQIDVACLEASTMLPQVRSGKIKGYAVLDQSRWYKAPELPTMDEAGAAGLVLSFWHGLWVPKGTPRAVVSRLQAAVVASLAEPAVHARFTDVGLTMATRAQETPDALAAYHKAEIEKWWPIIKAAGIKPE
jgi:tripartite-type tricarboxylate transporter receptor subunit TctC